jgi:V/A-type H+-transporting ATPase subunit E
MGLEVVAGDVLAKGKEEANRILQEGTDEANATISEAEQMAHRLLAERREQTAEQIERRRRREISSTHLDVKRSILNTQKEILDAIYDKATDTLSTLRESERENIIERLLASQTEFKRVFSNKQDEPIVRRLTPLEYGGNITCAGGILLENEDGSVMRDLTFDSLLDSMRETSIKRVSEILFE